MRHRECAAIGMLVTAFLIGSAGVGRSQPQLPSNSSPQPDFDRRFYFQNHSPADAKPSGNPAPDPQTQQPARSPIEGLVISPARAEPAPLGAPKSQGNEAAQTPAALEKPAAGLRKAANKPLAIGRASYYEHPGRTASGENYNPDGLTAAHKSLALGTRLRVVNLRNRKSVIVRVNDRSPAKMKFAIDLSRASAAAIGITKRAGTGLVALYKLD